jgi:hypothetical protein
MAYDAFYYTHESNGTGMIALAGVGGAEVKSNATRGTWPRLWAYTEWVFHHGTAPRLRTAGVVIGADQSEYVVHPIRNTQNVIVKWRFIMLESAGSGKVMTSSGTVLQTVPVGQYCDILVDSSGNMTSTTSPATFDPESTAGSEGVMDIVNEARQVEGV